MSQRDYNKKGFLLPDSLRSCAMYHAKIMPGGDYYFRIHDCISGIRLRGDLNDDVEKEEAVVKLQTLAKAANDFAEYIKQL